MKLVRNLILGALFITLCSFMAADGQVASDAYKYPVTGAKLSDRALDKDGDNRVAACQVPADVLAKMSTAGVVETSLTHPMFDYLDFQDNFQQYFTWLSGNANVYSELFKRPDAGKVLLDRVLTTQLNGILKYKENSPEYFEYFAMTKKLYFLVAQPQILAMLDNASRIQLLNNITTKMKDVKLYPNIYDGATFIYFFPYAAVKLMEMEKYQPFLAEVAANPGLGEYAKTAGPATKPVVESAIRLATNFTNSKKQ